MDLNRIEKSFYQLRIVKLVCFVMDIKILFLQPSNTCYDYEIYFVDFKSFGLKETKGNNLCA